MLGVLLPEAVESRHKLGPAAYAGSVGGAGVRRGMYLHVDRQIHNRISPHKCLSHWIPAIIISHLSSKSHFWPLCFCMSTEGKLLLMNIVVRNLWTLHWGRPSSIERQARIIPLLLSASDVERNCGLGSHSCKGLDRHGG